jgi:alpha-beta hydrolase superfamily lysophospholipase
MPLSLDRLSDGLHGHLTHINHLVKDYSDYFLEQLQRDLFQNKPFFLFGESMGGAIVFNLCTQSPLNPSSSSSPIRGAIMVAPMVGIAPEMMLPSPIMILLRAVASIIPLAPITPIPDIVDKCFKDPKSLLRTRQDPLGYQQKPRLGAALVMLETTEDIGRRLHELNTSLFILHGEDDVITCPKISTQLYNQCQSQDKMLTIYPKGCHGLLRGEYPERIEEIYRDVERWLHERS